MSKRIIQVLLIALMASSVSVAASTKVYKWMDAQGNVHFGDRPVNADAAQQLSLARSVEPSSARTADKKHLSIAEFMEQKRLQREEKLAMEKQQRAERKQNCHMAKDHFEGLTNASDIYDLDQHGQRVLLSKEQRTAAEESARLTMAHWCSQQISDLRY